jgi:hypothetical protein
MPIRTCTKTSQLELDLLQEALARNRQVFVVNGGNGMRSLLFAGDIIGVVQCTESIAEIGRIALFRGDRLFFGARVISGSHSNGWQIKSDCGYGKAQTIDHSGLIGIIDSLQIGLHIYPLWADHTSRSINREIAYYSTKILPTSTRSLIFSGRLLAGITRKIFKCLLRRKQKSLHKHLIENLEPLADIHTDGTCHLRTGRKSTDAE